jgi:hypothetical protein
MRTLTAGAISALSGAQVPAVLLVEMMFTTPLRLNSSAVTINWNGFDWLGAGPLGAVAAIKDVAGDAPGLQFTISGVPSENIALALGESARNRLCTVRLAVLNPSTHAVEDAPSLGVFRLDQLSINGGTIGVTAYPLSRVFARPKPIRYTDGDQQLVSAGDRGLEFVVSQAQHRDVWPAASSS